MPDSRYFNGLVKSYRWDHKVLTFTLDPAFDPDMRKMIVQALRAWSDVSSLAFKETSGNEADINIVRDDLPIGTYGQTAVRANATEIAHAHIAFDFDSAAIGNFYYTTILHEIGHALGLKHPFDGSPHLPGVSGVHDWGDFYENTFGSTVMASPDYFDFLDNNSPRFAGGPMALDIYAIQRMYGGVASFHGGDTSYTLGSKAYYQTIFDTGGADTIVYAGAKDVRIDLRAANLEHKDGAAGFLSSFVDSDGDFKKAAGGFTIAYGTTIENATGGSGKDYLVGNQANNILQGNAGNDALDGMGGKDTMQGGAGDDYYFVDNKADVVTEKTGEGTKDSVRILLGDQHSLGKGFDVKYVEYLSFEANKGIDVDVQQRNLKWIDLTAGRDILDLTVTRGGAATTTIKGYGSNDRFVFKPAGAIDDGRLHWFNFKDFAKGDKIDLKAYGIDGIIKGSAEHHSGLWLMAPGATLTNEYGSVTHTGSDYWVVNAGEFDIWYMSFRGHLTSSSFDL